MINDEPLCITSPLITSAAVLAGLQLYYAQLALNLVWTPLFFGLKQVGSTHTHNRITEYLIPHPPFIPLVIDQGFVC